MTVVTTVAHILDAAIHKSLMNDEGRSPLVGNEIDIIIELDRIVKEFYVDAARPPSAGSGERNDFFGETASVTLVGGTKVLPVATWTPEFKNASGARIHVTTQAAILDSLAPPAPAVYVQKDAVFTGGRTGDPGSTDVLTALFTAPPGTLTLRGDFIGADTPATASTSFWPEWAGNRYLIASIGKYLAVRDGIRDPTEVAVYDGEISATREILLALVRGINIAKRRSYVRIEGANTTVEDIMFQAIASIGVSDAAIDQLADQNEIFLYLDKIIQNFYTMAATPQELGGFGSGDYFMTNSTLTIAATPPALPNASFVPILVDAAGTRVHVVKQIELAKGIAELAPAAVVQGNTLQTAGRSGDPIAADVITLYYTLRPVKLVKLGDFIGATTVDDATTTKWPEYVGDRWLVARLALYLATKIPEPSQAVVGRIQKDIEEAAAALAQVVGVSATRLTAHE